MKLALLALALFSLAGCDSRRSSPGPSPTDTKEECRFIIDKGHWLDLRDTVKGKGT